MLLASPLPETLRPLLWSLRWEDINLEREKEEIIVSVINDGSLEQWRWLVKTYGRETIKQVLSRRLTTEFHPESRRLAEVLFGLTLSRYAR